MPKKKAKSGRFSEILPASSDGGGRGALLVGNADFAADEAALDELGVSAVLTVGGKQRAQARGGRTCWHCSVADAEEVSMLPLFEPTSSWIQEHRTSARSSARGYRPVGPGAVLVHCRHGMHRSPLIAAAYLIRFEGLDATQAMAKVKAARPNVTFRPEKQRELEEFHTSLAALKGDRFPTTQTRNATAASAPATPPVTPPAPAAPAPPPETAAAEVVAGVQKLAADCPTRGFLPLATGNRPDTTYNKDRGSE